MTLALALLGACVSGGPGPSKHPTPDTSADTGAAAGLTLAGELALPGAMDVWGEGDVVVVAGGDNPSTSVLVADISDPANPRALSTITGVPGVRDVELHDGLLYVASDCNCFPDSPEAAAWGGIGLRIYDLADPTRPVLLSAVGGTAASIHTFMVADQRVYASNMLENAIVFLDASDPTAPVELAVWRPEEGGVHDQTVEGSRLYAAHLSGFSVVDISNPAAPVTVQTVPVALLDGGYTNVHNAWPIEGGRYVATTQEQVGGKLRIWDMDAGAPVAERMEGEEPNAVHNAYVFDGRLYAAWYLDGVRVFDLEDPRNPGLLAEVDTFPEARSALDRPVMRGAWSVWADAGRMVVGDTDRGLLVFTEPAAWSAR